METSTASKWLSCIAASSQHEPPRVGAGVVKSVLKSVVKSVLAALLLHHNVNPPLSAQVCVCVCGRVGRGVGGCVCVCVCE